MNNSITREKAKENKNIRSKKTFHLSLTWEKITNWEYWPLGVVYFPIIIYWLWLSLKARSLFFFSASNPTILTGGMFGASKKKILDLIPDQFKAKTILIKKDSTIESILKKVDLNFKYPLIAKPDFGERGFRVEKIKNEQQLLEYSFSTNGDFIIQEFISLPVELGLFYYRFPDSENGIISSLTLKEFLSVTGDGRSTIRELIEAYPRAAFQLERLETKLKNAIHTVPAKGETILLEPIGNHCRGTKFLNANSHIDKQLTETFNKISKSIDGFYYGRFDLRCQSIELLKEGKEFKILELNGACAEPSHIYQPGFSLLSGYKVLFHHWGIIFKISTANHKKGIRYMSFKENIDKWNEVKKYKKTIQQI